MSLRRSMISIFSNGPTPYGYTLDFITATGITNTTIISALIAMESSLTSAGLIDYNNPSTNKFKALYPYVGGTATTHKYNFLDARDLDAAFRLQFNGGWVHDSNGATPNGINAYANTYFDFFNNGSANNNSISAYIRTNAPAPIKSEIGAYNATGSQAAYLALGGNYAGCIGNDLTNNLSTANADSRGFYHINKSASNSLITYKNGVNVNSSALADSDGRPAFDVFIGALAYQTTPVSYSTKQVAYNTLGYSLSAADAALFYTIVQTFQTSLSRQV